MSDEKNEERPETSSEAPSEDDAGEREPVDAEPGDAGEGGEPAETAPEEPKENRRERRRKKKRPNADEEAPRDRNVRVREQLLKKRTEAERAAEPLTTGEMVDDAVARGVAGASKWLRKNTALVQTAAVAIVLGGIGYAVWYSWSSGRAEHASTALMAGVTADLGGVDEKATPSPDDVYPMFPTAAAQDDAALAAYRKVSTGGATEGAKLLARLGEAGVLLDKKDWDGALTAYREVKASPLGAADPDVRGRAIEGVGFALEAKGDKDGALKAFKELEDVSEKGMKELAMYHQARLLADKGEKDKALTLIKTAKDCLTSTGDARNLSYLRGVLDDLHRKLDPASAPRPQLGGADRQISPEEIMKLQQQIQEQLKKAQDAHDPSGGKAPGSAPPASP